MARFVVLSLLLLVTPPAQFSPPGHEHYNCDFEKECQWKINQKGQWEFRIASGQEIQELSRKDNQTTGPLFDASNNPNGHFLYLASERPRIGDVAEIISPSLEGHEIIDKCKLTFKIHTSNKAYASLKLLLLNKEDKMTFWHISISGVQDSRWGQAGVSIRVRHLLKLSLEVVAEEAMPFHLAIDDIKLENCLQAEDYNCSLLGFHCNDGDCIRNNRVCDFVRDCAEGEDEGSLCDNLPEYSRCDFEKGICGWENEPNDMMEWIRTRQPNKNNEPMYDHTYGNSSGHYLYIEAEDKTVKGELGHAGIIRSTVLPPIPNYHFDENSVYYKSCEVSFYVFLADTKGQFVVNMRAVYEDTGRNNTVPVFDYYDSSKKGWTRFTAKMPQIYARYFLEFSVIRGFRYMNRIGLDDISLSRECFGLGVPSNVSTFQPLRYLDPNPPKGERPGTGSTKITAYHFTTCGQKGPNGPTMEHCKMSYKQSITNVTVLSGNFSGVQMWEVLKTNSYTIIAKGASGGMGVSSIQHAGKGTSIRAILNLIKGEKLYILVGQKGLPVCSKGISPAMSKICKHMESDSGNFGPRSNNRKQNRDALHNLKKLTGNQVSGEGGGGGGGATFIFKINENGEMIPVMIAAGGGGSGESQSLNHNVDVHGKGPPPPNFTNIDSLGEGSGGGWNSSNRSPTSGKSLLEGGQGGQVCERKRLFRTHGGFGGGGGACESGGGGGGYIGGASNNQSNTSGEGGWSYISPHIELLSVEPGNNSGDGEVDILSPSRACGCDHLCLFLDESGSDFRCLCLGGYSLAEDRLSCHSDYMPFAIQNMLIVIVIAIAIVLICSFICYLSCHRYHRKRFKKNRPPLSSNPELQLSRLRQATSGMVTEYNPNYEFDAACTTQNLKEVPRENLTLVKPLGQGAFGEVYQGYLCHMAGEAVEFPVAVKTLPELSSSQAEKDFLMEALIMAKFNHPNIVHFIGVCFDKHPRFIVLELLAGGDLKSFLRESRPKPERPSPLVMKDLLQCAIDVAKGCKYLEENHFIHRDIAARNCLLTTKGPGRVVKIADFGMARDIYRADYYRKGGKAMLPVKWMPPEAFLDGIFTSKTDVWSFGVLLWEVMSLGYMPYPGRGNQNVMQLVTNGGRLEAPPNCSPPIYRIMTQCWHAVPEDRPSFSTILERLGYCAQDPTVLSSPLPVFQRQPSNEREATMMRPIDTETEILSVQRRGSGPHSPSSTDYLLPSSYSLATVKTNLSSESEERLLSLSDGKSHSSLWDGSPETRRTNGYSMVPQQEARRASIGHRRPHRNSLHESYMDERGSPRMHSSIASALPLDASTLNRQCSNVPLPYANVSVAQRGVDEMSSSSPYILGDEITEITV